MTHKPPQGIDAALSYCARCNCRRYRNVEGKCEVCALYQTQRAAPPDPRKDLAALEELARDWVKRANWYEQNAKPAERDNTLPSNSYSLAGTSIQDCAGELEQRLAEMRGAKR